MPTYSYACTACDHRFDAQQSFTDDALTECPRCAGRLRKLFGSVGVVFKGSGFYRTDSRSGGSGSSASVPAKGSGESGGSSSGGSTDGSSSGGSSSGGSSSSTPSSGSSGSSAPAPSSSGSSAAAG